MGMHGAGARYRKGGYGARRHCPLPSGLYRRPRNFTESVRLRGVAGFTAGGELHPAPRTSTISFSAGLTVVKGGCSRSRYTGRMSRAVVIDEVEGPYELPLPAMTYEEFLVHPDVPERAEWVCGKAIAMGTVSRVHARITAFLVTLLNSFVDANSLGEVFHEPFNMKLQPGQPGRTPDVFVVLAAHLGRVAGNHLLGAADIAVEVLSTGTAATDRGAKFYEYEAGGVTEYWLIDPQREVAEFYHLDDRGHYQLMPTSDGVFRSDVLPGFFLRVAWLWDRPKVRDAEVELGIR